MKKAKKRTYTNEYKESVLKRLEQPTNDTIASISDELKISKSTIYEWIRAKEKDTQAPKSKKKLTSADKFHVIMETYTLTEHELAAYCRRKGLFVSDVQT